MPPFYEHTAYNPDMASKHRFRTTLFKGGDAPNASTFAQMEFDSVTAFDAKGRVPVKGTINGFAFKGTLMPYGGKHLLTVNKALQAGAKAKAGDKVEIVIERDDAPRTVEAPSDLAAALRKNKAAQSAWDKLAYSHKREYVEAIEEAKKPETRARRIAVAVEQLAKG